MARAARLVAQPAPLVGRLSLGQWIHMVTEALWVGAWGGLGDPMREVSTEAIYRYLDREREIERESAIMRSNYERDAAVQARVKAGLTPPARWRVVEKIKRA